MTKLSPHNYKDGFLVSDEFIGGVTEMADGSFAAYVSHHLTGETLAYQEFTSPLEATEFLSALPFNWAFEAVGCSSHTKKTAANSQAGCGPSSCSSCSCK